MLEGKVMDDVTFYDLHQGDMLLHEWGDVPWLFVRGAEGQWVSFRKADEDDLRRLVSFKDDKEKDIWQQALGRSPKAG